MKYPLISYIAAFFILPISYASSVPQEWSCLSFDAKEQSYKGKALTLDEAMKNAKSSCQKSSSQAKTCRTAQSYCEEQPISGQGRCIVTDDDGHAWDIDGEDSCKKAMSMCNRFLYLEGGAHGQCWIKYGGESGNLDVD
jgi:hypothetical protein